MMIGQLDQANALVEEAAAMSDLIAMCRSDDLAANTIVHIGGMIHERMCELREIMRAFCAPDDPD